VEADAEPVEAEEEDEAAETTEAEEEPAEAEDAKTTLTEAENEDEPAEATDETVATEEEATEDEAALITPAAETDTLVVELAAPLDAALLEDVDGFTTTAELVVPVQVPNSGLQPVLQ
jgi:hypothetical protein